MQALENGDLTRRQQVSLESGHQVSLKTVAAPTEPTGEVAAGMTPGSRRIRPVPDAPWRLSAACSRRRAERMAAGAGTRLIGACGSLRVPLDTLLESLGVAGRLRNR